MVESSEETAPEDNAVLVASTEEGLLNFFEKQTAVYSLGIDK